MNVNSVGNIFLFQGSAVALGAHIRRPRDFFVPAVASSTLPITGGLAEAQSPGQSFDIISYDSASTRVIGDFTDPLRAAEFTLGNHRENDLPVRTMAECKLRGLKIQIPGPASGEAESRRTFIADHLEVQMESSSYRRGGTEFRSLRAVIEGVSVDGYALKVKTNTEVFAENETKEKLAKTYQESSQFRKRYGKQFFPVEESSGSGGLGSLLGTKHEIPMANGLIFGTIVTSLEWEGKKAADTEIRGHELVIDGLGSIYFGEILIEEASRRLVLIRFQLGSPDGGEGSACGTQANGHGWPPKK